MIIIYFLILGFLTSLLFPPYFFIPLGFIIFPFLCIIVEKILRELNKYSHFICGFFYGFAFFISYLFWIKNPFFIFEETKMFFYFSILLIILLSIIFGVIFTVIINIYKFLHTVILVPLIFITIEFIISIFLYGFPWVSFSLIISSIDYLSFCLKYFGTFITSYLVIQIFCLPFLLINNKFQKYQLIFTLLIFIPLIISLFISFINDKNNIYKSNKINIEIFQLNSQNTIDNSKAAQNLSIIKKNILNSDSEILIFAENNYPYLIRNIKKNEIQNIVKKNQIIIIGATRLENNNYYNSLLNITKSDILYFDKKILVPFGEFLPLRNLLSFMESISGSNDYTIGNKERYIKIDNNISYIPVICYEIIFYWKLINDLNYKSNFIVNLTNDVWFGKFLGPYQHFYLSKLRAAEFNKIIIRVSNNGISGIINEEGKVLSTIKLNDSSSKKYSIDVKKRKNFYKTHLFLKFYFFIIFILLILYNLIKQNEYRQF